MSVSREWEAPSSSARAAPGSDEQRCAGATRCIIESLEARTLLAVTLPDGFEQTVWTRGFTVPTAQEFTPDGRLFVTEKAGAVRVVSAKGKLLDEPFVTVPADTFVDRGLVSIAIDPKFEKNRSVYLYYTIRKEGGDAYNRLSRFKADNDDPDVAAKGSERILLESPMDSALHTGGMMHFGTDGMLYLGIGDSGSGGRAQRLNEIRGKVLRLDVSNYPDSIVPDDNPFVGQDNVREEIFALGFRNPFSGAIDALTGKVFINDVGHESFEEVNHAEAGNNHGWPLAEGRSDDDRFVNPIYSYPKNNVGAAVTGGMFYRGGAMPAGYNGNYFFADYLRGWIKRLDPDDDNRVVDFATGAEGPLDLDVGPDGSIYYLSAFGNGFSGTNRPVYRISFVGGDNRRPQAVATAKVTSGELPLEVKFYGSKSSDPDRDTLTYTWNFGDGSKPVTDANPVHTYKKKGRYRVRLTVSDGMGGQTTAAPITILAGFTAPRAKIKLPKESLTYVAGNKIKFAGRGIDEEDGKLGMKQFEWSVVFVHADHMHEFEPSIPGVLSGNFRTATTGETDPDQGYQITLTVTDSDGVTDRDSVIVHPRKADVIVRTNVKGLTFTVDGHEYETATRFLGVAGLERELSAPKRQTVKGTEYVFAGWSDGGKRTHIVRPPAKDIVYVARYKKVAPAADNGLSAIYFNKANFSGAAVERVDDTVDFQWGQGAPIGGIDADSFSVRWFGQVKPGFTEKYTFFVNADDGARLTINGKVVIDALKSKGLGEHVGRITLKAGKLYDVQLEHVERKGRAVAQLFWKSPSTPKQIVPRNRLFAAEETAKSLQRLGVLSFNNKKKSKKPNAPAKVRAEARSRRLIRVIWRDRSKNETAFFIYRRTPDDSFSLLAKLPENADRFVDRDGVEANTKYKYKVRAVNEAGKSSNSNVAAVRTPKPPKPKPEPEPEPEPEAIPDFNITWESAADAPIGRHEAIGTAADGKLYVFGGFTPQLKQISDAHAYDPAADTWQRLADLPEPMTHGSAVYDGDDSIYVAGFFEGRDHFGDGSHNVWVYDISDDEWSAGPRLPTRQGAAVMVKVGRDLHFFGGLDPGRDVNSTGHWVWNLDGGTAEWTSRASMPNPKDHLAAVELDGKIYAIGGELLGNDVTMNHADAHVYDPATDQWSEIASLPLPWSHASSSTVVYAGKILTIGGQTDGRVPLKYVMAYDPAANEWTHLQGIPRTRKSPVAGVIGNTIVVQGGEERGPEATTWIGRIVPTDDPEVEPELITMPMSIGEVAAGAIDGKIYMVGEGNNVTAVYDPATGAWDAGLAKRPNQGHHHAAEVFDGKLYLIGGLGSGAGKVQIYDPEEDAWTHGADMPFASGSVSTALINGEIYVAGGIIGSRTTDLAAKYDPRTNVWTMLAPMPEGRNHAASATDGEKLYVFGGRGPGSGDANFVANGFDTVQVYDPGTDTWTIEEPLPQARGGMGKAVFANGEFYVMGGETATGAGATKDRVYDRVDIYDPETDSWRSGRPLLVARHGIFPVLIGGVIYLPGGGTKAGASTSAILEIYPV